MPDCEPRSQVAAEPPPAAIVPRHRRPVMQHASPAPAEHTSMELADSATAAAVPDAAAAAAAAALVALPQPAGASAADAGQPGACVQGMYYAVLCCSTHKPVAWCPGLISVRMPRLHPLPQPSACPSGRRAAAASCLSPAALSIPRPRARSIRWTMAVGFATPAGSMPRASASLPNPLLRPPLRRASTSAPAPTQVSRARARPPRAACEQPPIASLRPSLRLLHSQRRRSSAWPALKKISCACWTRLWRGAWRGWLLNSPPPPLLFIDAVASA